MENHISPEENLVDTNPYREALNILRNEGWVKSDLEDEQGRCIVGAVAHVTGNEIPDLWLDPAAPKMQRNLDLNHIYSLPELDLLNEIVNEQYSERVQVSWMYPACVFFNDDDATEFDDVALVLEKAAVRFDEKI